MYRYGSDPLLSQKNQLVLSKCKYVYFLPNLEEVLLCIHAMQQQWENCPPDLCSSTYNRDAEHVQPVVRFWTLEQMTHT